MLLDNFNEITSEQNIKQLTELNTVFVPNRSFSVYAGYENIEEKFTVPLMGNRSILRTEEQYSKKPTIFTTEGRY